MPIGLFLAGRCRLSEALVASDLRRQFAEEVVDRGPDAADEVSIAGFRGVLDLGAGVANLSDNCVVFGIEFDADRQGPTQRFQRVAFQS